MRTLSDISHQWCPPPIRKSALNIPFPPVRYRAIAMELSAHLDEQYVEMKVLTDTGKKIVIVCDRDSIFSIQRHIEQIGRACPEISDWKPAQDAEKLRRSDRRSYEAALWEGWPVS